MGKNIFETHAVIKVRTLQKLDNNTKEEIRALADQLGTDCARRVCILLDIRGAKELKMQYDDVLDPRDLFDDTRTGGVYEEVYNKIVYIAGTIYMNKDLNHSKNAGDAMNILSFYKEKGISPNIVTINTYLKVLSKDTNYSYKKEDFNDILEDVDTIYSEISTKSRNTLHYMLQNEKWYTSLHRDFGYIWLIPSTPAHITPKVPTQPTPAVSVSTILHTPEPTPAHSGDSSWICSIGLLGEDPNYVPKRLRGSDGHKSPKYGFRK